MKRTIALIAALALLCSLLCGCASGPSAPAESAAPEEVYTARFQTLRFPEGVKPRLWTLTGNALFATAQEKLADGTVPEGKSPEYEGQYDVMGWRLYRVKDDGTAERLAYEPLPAPEDTEERRGYTAEVGVEQLLPGPDGGLLVLESVSLRWYTGEAAVPESDPDYWEHVAFEAQHILRLLDADGQERSRAPLTMDGLDAAYLYEAAADSAGRVYLPVEGALWVFAPNGTALARIDTGEGWIYDLAGLRDGRVAALMWRGGMRLFAVDVENAALEELLALDGYPEGLYEGSGDYDLYRTDGTGLFGLRLEDGSEEEVLDFLDCDLSPQELQLLASEEDGSFRGVCLLDGEDLRALTLRKEPRAASERTELTLGALSGTAVGDAVLRFNRSQDQVRIRVRDYSDYVRGDDYEAGLTKLVTEILAGDMPDLLALDSLPYAQLAAKGLLEDLYPWLDADGELKREDFFENVLRSMEVSGGLYEVTPGFSIITLMGASERVGDTPGWTYDDFDAALAGMPAGSTPLGPGVSRDMILEVCIYLNLDRFLDWGSGTCNFEDPAFLRLLAFCAQFPDSAAPDEDGSDMSRIAEGRQMLYFTGIYSMDDAVYNDQLFPGGATYIGLPVDEGVGNVLYPSAGYAMSAKCADKEAAWRFLRGFLTEAYQTKYSGYEIGLPLNRAAFQTALDKAMEIEYEKDAEGHYLLDANGERIPTTKGGMSVSTDGEAMMDFELWAMTPAQAEKLRGVVESAAHSVDMNATVAAIVREEAAAFFAGQKSAAEVARLIQSKVGLYVSEQR